MFITITCFIEFQDHIIKPTQIQQTKLILFIPYALRFVEER